jgi:chemotaxis protein methyltransferase CheR
MYFTPRQVKKVISNLSGTLVEDGWLIVSPSEASQALFPQFTSVNFPGAILFQKGEASHIAETRLKQVSEFTTSTTPLPLPRESTTDLRENPESSALNDQPGMTAPFHDVLATAQVLYKEGHYAEVADNLLAVLSEHHSKSSSNPAVLSLLTRALANLGRLTTALIWCDRWIEADKLNPAAHYLRAVILLEHGDPERARPSLQRTVYLHPGFVLAHFALGNIARGRKRMHEAGRYFSNALRLLRDYEPNDLLPETDCLTASRLTEIITIAIAKKNIS